MSVKTKIPVQEVHVETQLVISHVHVKKGSILKEMFVLVSKKHVIHCTIYYYAYYTQNLHCIKFPHRLVSLKRVFINCKVLLNVLVFPVALPD